jgi:hypothetical protein
MSKAKFVLGTSVITLVLAAIVMAPPLTQALVNIVNPADGSSFSEGNVFRVTADVICSRKTCPNTQVTISVPAGLSLPNNDATHSLGKVTTTNPIATSWDVSGNQAGNYVLTVTSVNSDKHAAPHTDSVSVNINATPTPTPSGSLTVVVTQPHSGTNITIGSWFYTNSTVSCSGGPCNGVVAEVFYSNTVLSLQTSKVLNLGNMVNGQTKTAEYLFQASTTAAGTLITVQGTGTEGQLDSDSTTVNVV